MKKKIKIWVTDFTKDIDPRNNPFISLIAKDYDLSFDPINPDYLIYGPYGFNFLNYKKAIRIYYTGENLFPDFNLCDYAVGFHYFDFQDRYLRYPLFAIMRDQFKEVLLPKENTTKNLVNKVFFCNFIYSNANANPFREKFYYSLSNYKKIHSVGSHLKNHEFDVGGRYSKNWMYSKLEFQSQCKFTIAFENSYCPGYTTEKILHAFISNTIPIYWGNPEISRDFNPGSFINCHDYDNLEQVIERVKELDNNNEEYLKVLNTPPFINKLVPKHLLEETLSNFFKNIFDQEKNDAYRRPKYGFIKSYESKLFNLNFRRNRIQILINKFKKRLR